MKISSPRCAVLLTALCALPLAACGSGSGGDAAKPSTGSAGSAGSAGAAAAAFPRTVQTSHGKVSIKAAPKRIVVLGGAQEAEAVIALGGSPVAIDTGGAALPPWLKGRTGSAKVETIAQQQSVKVETVAAAKPDLILSSNYITKFPGVADKLKAIAPLVDVPNKSVNPDWDQVIANVADALGKPQQGNKLVKNLRARMTAAGKGVPKGTTYDWVRLDNSGWGFGNGVLLDSFGLEPDKSQHNDNDTTLSLERTDRLTADAVFVWPYGKTEADVKKTPGVAKLTATKKGTLQIVSLNFALALNSPGAYSIPWIVKEIEPTLAKLSK